MTMREKIKALDEIITDAQRATLKATLHGESWDHYESLVDGSLNDQDDYTLAIIRFGVSLTDPEAFKGILTPEQRAIIEAVEADVRRRLELS